MSDKINSVSYYDMAQNEKSTKARTDMYQKGAEVGDVKCMHGMCKEMWENARTVRADAEIVCKYLNKGLQYAVMAAQSGNTDILIEFAEKMTDQYHNYIYSDEPDIYAEILTEGYLWFCKAAEYGDERGFARIKYSEECEEMANKLLAPKLRKLKSKENKTYKDYFELSLFYKYGVICEKNNDKATEYQQKSAKRLYSDSKYKELF